MKQFYCAKYKAKLKHDADVCRHACDVNLEAMSVIKSGTLFLAVPTMLLGKHFLVRMGSTMALKRTNAANNGINVNLFFMAHAHVHAKLYEV